MTEPEPEPTGPGYAEAVLELDEILRDLEGPDPDVDVLAARVERASELIEICRARITRARVNVEQVVARLDPSAESEEPES